MEVCQHQQKKDTHLKDGIHGSSGGTQITSTTKYTTVGNQTIYAQWKQDKVLATTAITPSTYGDNVNYSANGASDWKIFLNDGTNIYLISTECVNKMRFTSTVYKDGNYSVYAKESGRLDSWLNSTYYFEPYAEGFSGATATGGPTFSQFWESYNKKYGTNYSGEYKNLKNEVGYSNLLYFTSKEGNGYWLNSSKAGSTSELGIVHKGVGTVQTITYASKGYGVRPMVKLPAGIYASKGIDNKWTFSK